MKKLRTWDPVMVIAGKYKGTVSTIESFVDEEHVIVKWVNEVKRAVKGKWFIKKTLPIHISNVMYYLEQKKQPTRIRIITDDSGKKVRQAVKDNSIIK